MIKLYKLFCYAVGTIYAVQLVTDWWEKNFAQEQ